MTSKISFLSLMILVYFSGYGMCGEIHKAAKKGNLSRIKEIAKNDPEAINMKEKGFEPPLHIAIENGRTKVAIWLIESGADIEAVNGNDETPLNLSVKKNGNEKIVSLLLEKGASIETRDYLGRRPLHNAASCGNENYVDMLLAKGADIEAETKEIGDGYFEDDPARYDGRTPLYEARNKMLKYLLEKGANPNKMTIVSGFSRDKVAILHYFADYGRTKAIVTMLQHGADINIKAGIDGNTPLHYAVNSSHYFAVKTLIASGADVNAKNSKGITPLQLVRKKHKSIAYLLIRNGAKLDLIAAVRLGMINEVKKFLKQGPALIKQTDKVLSEARSNSEFFRYDRCGGGLIFLPALYGEVKMVKLLAENGANVNLVSTFEKTALDSACEKKNKKLIEILLKHGAIHSEKYKAEKEKAAKENNSGRGK